MDSSDEEDNNHDTTAENTDLEENIENIAKLVRKSSSLKNKDTPKTKAKVVPDPPKSKLPEKSASTKNKVQTKPDPPKVKVQEKEDPKKTKVHEMMYFTK